MKPRIHISYSILNITGIMLIIFLTVTLLAPSVSAHSSTVFITDIQPPLSSETGTTLPADLQVLSSDLQNLILEFKIPPFEIIESQNNESTCQIIDIQEFAEIREPGWPRLPIYGTMVGVPTESQPSLTVLESNLSPITGNYNLCAVETNHYERDETGALLYTGKQAIPDPQVYTSQDFIPKQTAEIISTGYLRSQRVAQIRINPFQYNPSNGELRYLKYLKLQVNFGDQSPKLVLPQSSPPDEGIFESILEDKGPSNQLFYDASDKFEDYDTLDPIAIQLKKRGMGPYVIHDLSASGVVHLATLDGETMAKWICGYRLKKYH